MRRYRWEIWAQLLTEALIPKEKTNLMYQVNLTYRTVKGHLEALVALGLLEEKSNPHHMFRTTWKGREWLRQFKDLQRLLET